MVASAGAGETDRKRRVVAIGDFQLMILGLCGGGCTMEVEHELLGKARA